MISSTRRQFLGSVAAVIINGDLAMSVGTPGDYASFARLIEPLREAGLPLHLTLGNHDNRTEFLHAFADVPSATQFKDHRHNGVLDLPHAGRGDHFGRAYATCTLGRDRHGGPQMGRLQAGRAR